MWYNLGMINSDTVSETLPEIKRVGVILRPSSPELKELFYRVKAIFESYNVEVMLDSISASMIGLYGQDFEWLCKECDILITLGGDGTLISAVRRSHQSSIPVLGIHAGKLGFLADVDPAEAEDFIASLMSGDYRVDKRLMLEVEIATKENSTTLFALNDVVVTRPSISKMIHLDAMAHGQVINTYYGDGLIVSTPTGSTAYNLSSGGPVLFPLTHAFIMTPICPHSLTQRPVVLPGHLEVSLKTYDEQAVVSIDGQEMYEFNSEDVIKVKVSSQSAKLIHRLEHNYFDVLREKLKWGE